VCVTEDKRSMILLGDISWAGAQKKKPIVFILNYNKGILYIYTT
jgi:hypothetical protein